ncbi:hypothetical protein IV38_GL000581 [Lactobacillus selangorensis]|uniref:Uncharacterized protein n=1 Tax=Lactobacillus selangorensis TaxID=81857 RepID=A0A0R2FZ55_9LACO|nr:hypothetical protein IV38_GL000581 [Lactobacillus selangorensis]KRN33777.1 hypothetical protein IV40_GL000087 [Lactobacillus selangorensis]
MRIGTGNMFRKRQKSFFINKSFVFISKSYQKSRSSAAVLFLWHDIMEKLILK